MIRVLSPGIYTTIQDLGRSGVGSYGVPSSGAMDQFAAQLGNYLLQNESTAAVLEITFGGCKLAFEEATAICITGADFSPQIDGKNVKQQMVVWVQKGSVLSFGKRMYGVRTYVAVSGGFQTERVLGSRSMYKGITSAHLITKGMQLTIGKTQRSVTSNHASVKVNKMHFQSQVISCFKGPEFEWLSKEQQRILLTQEFTISPDHSRMGYRLEEEVVNDLPSMLTAAVLPGTVQLTPSGKLIVLMRDCQVTGGYPRVLQLSEEAINCMAQKATADTIQFQIIT